MYVVQEEKSVGSIDDVNGDETNWKFRAFPYARRPRTILVTFNLFVYEAWCGAQMIPGAFYCDRDVFETISGPISFNASRAKTARKNSIHSLACGSSAAGTAS